MNKRLSIRIANALKPGLGARVSSRRFIIALLFVCAFSGLAVVLNKASGFRTGASEAPASNATLPAPAAPQGGPSSRPLQGETVVIRPWGFEPDEISRPQSQFVLRVDNRSGLDEVSLRLDGQSGGSVRAAAVPRSKLDWRDTLDLPPGTYLLKEAGHPGWECKITITP